MARMRSTAPATWSIAKPNFESAWPVEIFSCVSPRTLGVARTSTGCGGMSASSAVGPGASGPKCRSSSRSRRSISSRLSITISPTRWRSAIRSSASDLALPCSTSRSGAKPALQREVHLPAGGHVAPQPLLRERAQHGGAGEGLGGEQHVQLRAAWPQRPGPAAASASAQARGRPPRRPRPRRRSSSATTYAGVPNSRASSIVSHPPTSRRPRSLMRLPSGNTRARLSAMPVVVSVAIAVWIIAVAPRLILRPVAAWTCRLYYSFQGVCDAYSRSKFKTTATPRAQARAQTAAGRRHRPDARGPLRPQAGEAAPAAHHQRRATPRRRSSARRSPVAAR